jgi:dihydroorotase/N-acyl-D-amino-acid deacylase
MSGSTSYDTLIRGARIVDGTGNPWLYGDVALAGERIAAITPPGAIDVANAAEVVDATGLMVAPGFIDIQSHSIMPLMRDPRCLSKITQGVTTEIMGEGWTPAPFGGLIPEPREHDLIGQDMAEWRERMRGWARFGDWLDAFVERGVSPNVGSFLGGGTLRQYGKGMALGPANADELAVMRRVMAESMQDGAFGVSYALIYPPDAFVGIDELVEVCKVVAQHNGVYITHIRSEAHGLEEGIAEAIEIGRRSGAPVEIYHLKASGVSNWPKMPRVIEQITAARAAGVDVTADMYPYVASGTGLAAVLPPWSAADDKFFENLADPTMRARIRAEVLKPSGDWEAMAEETGPAGVMPVGFTQPHNQQYVGQRLDAIAAARGQAWVDAVLDLLVDEQHDIFTMYFGMSEENIALQLQQPWMKVSTDAGGVDPSWAKAKGPTHPRAYGTYPRVLGKHVREEGVLPLEDAIRKMSSAVADRLGLRDRGLLCDGYYADVIIFDPTTIGDRATFEDPHQLSVGVRDVWVNGQRVLRDGAHTGATPGQFVKGGGA